MPAKKIGEMLVAEHVLLPAQVEEALAIQVAGGNRKRLGAILVEMGALDAERLTQVLARQMGLPYVDPLVAKIDPQAVWRVPRRLAERHKVLAFAEEGRALRVAMPDPANTAAVQDLEFTLKCPVRIELASEARILQAIRRHYDMEPIAQRLLKDVPKDLHGPALAPTSLDLDESAIEHQLKSEGNLAYVRLLNFLLVNAIERGASDIHMEPHLEGVRVRFRVDGLLRDALDLPAWAGPPLVSRVKVVGRMDIAEKRKPQDGRTSVELGKRRVDLRLSVVPSQFGETVVMRLLDSQTVKTDLGSLGWNPRQLAAYFHVVSQPQGLVLVVGPTGSGKTTTLYATINRLKNETSAIVSVEDPIEHTMSGVAQIQVAERQGMTYASLVRSLLRQDPDIMVIGEIRDDESALATTEAANTGHLVISTLHTGHSIGAITRLRDMNVPAYLLGGTLQGVVAQRLVRRVCQVCSVAGRPEAEEWERLGLDPLDLGDKVRRVGSGCPACQYMGYVGRIGVFEVLAVDDNLRGAILRGAQETEMWGLARAAGLTTLLDDALEKVREGLTTLEEIAGDIPVDPWRPRRRRRLGGDPNTGARAGDPRTNPRPVEPRTGARPADTRGARPTITQRPAPEPPPPPAPAAEPVVELGAESLAPLEPQGLPVVLAVDDAEEILTLISATLEGNYQVELARDGVDALEMVGKVKPDVLVLDVMMPRMTGYEVAQKLKEDPKTREIPVLMLSARGDTAHVKQGFHAGADDYLPKPFDPEELELRLRALLRRARRGG